MTINRRFQLAPSLARLIEKEREGRLIIEGYFPDQSDRSVYVRVEENAGTLILVSPGLVETPADLPHAYAEALLGLVAGAVAYRRIDLRVGTAQIHVSRIIASEPLDLITAEFVREEQAREFEAMPWFGPEVTNEPGYRTRSLALAGLPAMREVDLTGAALNSLLDFLDIGSASVRPPVGSSVWADPLRAEAVDEDAEDLGIEDSAIHDQAPSPGSRPR